MSKSYRNPIRIDNEDIPEIRKSWGDTRPFTRIQEDRKKRKDRQNCRDFKRNWRQEND
jgi:hypothetical protein